MKKFLFLPLLLLTIFSFSQRYDHKCTANSVSDVQLADSGQTVKSGRLEYGKFKIRVREISGSRTEGELKINKEKYKLVEKGYDTTFANIQRKIYHATDKNNIKMNLILAIYRKEGGWVDHYVIYLIDPKTLKGKHYYGWVL